MMRRARGEDVLAESGRLRAINKSEETVRQRWRHGVRGKTGERERGWYRGDQKEVVGSLHLSPRAVKCPLTTHEIRTNLTRSHNPPCSDSVALLIFPCLAGCRPLTTPSPRLCKQPWKYMAIKMMRVPQTGHSMSETNSPFHFA